MSPQTASLLCANFIQFAFYFNHSGGGGGGWEKHNVGDGGLMALVVHMRTSMKGRWQVCLAKRNGVYAIVT